MNTVWVSKFSPRNLLTLREWHKSTASLQLLISQVSVITFHYLFPRFCFSRKVENAIIIDKWLTSKVSYLKIHNWKYCAYFAKK